ncbi:hypothetical protein TSUD_126570 [Trifolium subterraneum]|uniref:Reverse transcriptase domain-containing protein n=1 Tax=Trifolium subterraneum TaxID=3900 RepID=A0A2Z6M6P7_TRISU|nr:hypothetical protein TSUD_126570 [Trifolium subterraneum]
MQEVDITMKGYRRKDHPEDNDSLLQPFSVDEVRDVIWSCDGNKCPGPDGYNFNFLKNCWTIVKKDVIEFLNEFHRTAILPKAITASFLTLVPKKDHPQRVMRKLCQTAFLPNRQILDGVVVINEIIDLAKRRKNKCMLLKVDFERAYDTVNWMYLEDMMLKMGFAEGWLKWMKACIFNSSMSVLVNGSPTEDFQVGKALRQGDPLSPFLFLIAAEGLTGLMQKAVELGKFKSFKVNDNLNFRILQFADDTVIIGEGDWNNLWTIKTVMRSFELVSGLKINFFKSKLYGINLDDRYLEAASAFLSCSIDQISFCFLGLPVGANPRRLSTWRPIIDTMRKRLLGWSGRHLSIGGRVTLINSVLSSLPLYYFSFFKVPSSVLKVLVSIQRNFLWGGGLEGKICWVKWDTICLPKDRGGLGIKNLDLFNLSLLSKWKWRCLTEPNVLWSELLKFRYGSFSDNFLCRSVVSAKSSDSLWWRDILKVGEVEGNLWFSASVSSILGDGKSIGFWKEKWIGNASLKELFSNLFEKEIDKNAVVADKGRWETVGWSWVLFQEGVLLDNAATEAADLLSLLADYHPFDRNDNWKWIPEAYGQFSVSSTYQFLQQRTTADEICPNVVGALKRLWKNDLPSKVSIFG